MRQSLALSRVELSRFLGVSEATVARWEASERPSEPRGLQAFLLELLADAHDAKGAVEVARLVRRGGIDYRSSLSTLLVSTQRAGGSMTER